MLPRIYRLPFRLMNVPVQLDLTFLLVLPLLAWLIGSDLDRFILAFDLEVDPAQLTTGILPYVLGFMAALGLFLSILIHELGHALVGRWYSLKIRSITLWVLGGMAKFDRIPHGRGTEALMAIAGPVTSFILAGGAGILQTVMPDAPGGIRFLLAYLLYMNLVVATFNLIPALPLDGGRVLRSLLATRIGYLRATQISATLSKILALLLGLVGFLLLNIWMMLIAFFIFVAVSGEAEQASITTALRGIRVREIMTRSVAAVDTKMYVSDLIQRMFEQRHVAFPVLDSSGHAVGLVTIEDVRRMKSSGRDESSTRVEEIMSPTFSTTGEGASALEAFHKISRSTSGRLLVLDRSGELRGIVSKTDLLRAVQLRTEA